MRRNRLGFSPALTPKLGNGVTVARKGRLGRIIIPEEAELKMLVGLRTEIRFPYAR